MSDQVVRIAITTVYELDEERYDDEETEQEFLDRIERAVNCGDLIPSEKHCRLWWIDGAEVTVVALGVEPAPEDGDS